MRKVRIEHPVLTDEAWLARPVDAETGDLLENVVALDLNLVAGNPIIAGVLTFYLLDEKGQVVYDYGHEEPEPETYTEEVEIVYIDTFDQYRVANSE